jgi:murein DD-endopeptidase MepM/ murein hydrolase activator NlpD
MRKEHLTAGTRWLYNDGTIHAGHDHPTIIGTPVYAVRSGTILNVVNHIKNLGVNENGEKGDPPNFVMLGITYKHKPATVVYLHVSPVPDSPVRRGDEVMAGDLIALSGHNGHSEGPHLHVSALTGRAQLDKPFHYLDGLRNNSKQPTNGLARNGFTIYPPRLVYGQEKSSVLDGGDVVMADLHVGTRDSDSVRRLQRLLNRMPRKHGRHLKVTGDYRAATRDEVRKWQVHVRHNDPDSPLADGNVHRNQARVLFRDPAFRLI